MNNLLQWLFAPSRKWVIKTILLAVGIIIFFLVLIFSNLFVSDLIEREKNSITLFAEIYQKYSNPSTKTEDIEFLAEKMSKTIKFPVIMTDEMDEPIFPFEDYSLNIKFHPTWNTNQKREYLRKLIQKMGSEYPPIVALDENGKVFVKFYYSHSALLERLKYFPIIEILIAFIFIGFAYIAFRNLRKNEESRLWVGMAKEAAHQLGTPISSLLAWVEILKDKSTAQSADTKEVINEIEKDVIRLQTISQRFSKIGSFPEIKRENLVEILDEAIGYFETRMPHLGKKISIRRNYPKDIVFVDVNRTLFSWVIENLLKNSVEAIETTNGFIEINVQVSKKKIILTIKDNGKGMSTKQRLYAFQPGFTTKKRGWGLGLTFCKRIIEEYHQSKIFIKETSPHRGTTIAIELPNKFHKN